MTDTALVDSWAGDIVRQVDSFEAHFVPAPEAAAWQASETLFTLFIGINDIGHAQLQGKKYADLVGDLFASYDAQVARLYAAGARNFLMLVSHPPAP